MRKIYNIFYDIVIVVLILLVAAVLIPKLCFGCEMKAVLTGSMEPELPIGSLIVIRPVEYEDIQVGDDITFVRDQNLNLVTHRVVAKDDATRHITTKGIANNIPDAPTVYENVVGKVVFDIPLVGYLVIALETKKGKIIAGIVIIAFLLISTIIDKLLDDGSKSKTEEK